VVEGRLGEGVAEAPDVHHARPPLVQACGERRDQGEVPQVIGAEVDLEAVRRGRRDGARRAARVADHARVGDDRVDPSLHGERRRGRAHGGEVREVQPFPDDDGARHVTLDAGGGRGGALGVPRGDDHPCPEAGELFGGEVADAAGRAGDEHRASREWTRGGRPERVIHRHARPSVVRGSGACR